jgi:hypothetical protein
MNTHAVAARSIVASLLLLLISALAGCGSGPGGTGGTPAPAGQQSPELTDGVLVVQVFPGSEAEKAGLKPGDIIIGYNGVSTPDNVIYDKAKAEADAQKLATVDLTVLRGTALQTVKVPGGTIGFEKRSWVGVLEAVFSRLEQGKLDQAKEILDVAEKEGALNTEQLLVGRIWAIPDTATPEQETQRGELLSKLFEIVPIDTLTEFARLEFVNYRRHAAAAACFQRVIKERPADTQARLELALAYTALAKYDDADRELAVVEKDRKSLTEAGQKVVERTRANVALGKKDYKAALAYYSAVVSADSNPQDWVSQSIYLYCAARSTDSAEFSTALERVKKLQGENLGPMDVNSKLLETFALSLQKKAAEATAKAKELPEDLPAQIVEFWQRVPEGQDVIDRWRVARQA